MLYLFALIAYRVMPDRLVNVYTDGDYYMCMKCRNIVGLFGYLETKRQRVTLYDVDCVDIYHLRSVCENNNQIVNDVEMATYGNELVRSVFGQTPDPFLPMSPLPNFGNLNNLLIFFINK